MFIFIVMLSWLSLQHTSISPDRRLVAVVGDHVDGLLMDSQNGKVPRFYFISPFSSYQNE